MEKFEMTNDRVIKEIIEVTNAISIHTQKADEYDENNDSKKSNEEKIKVLNINSYYIIKAYALLGAIQGDTKTKIPVKYLIDSIYPDDISIDITYENHWREVIERLGFEILKNEEDDDNFIISWAHAM